MGGLGNDLPLLMLSLFTFALLPVFVFMTAADTFTGEVQARTLKLILMRPITRAKVYASKVLTLAIYIAVQLGTLWLASVLTALFIPEGAVSGVFWDSIKAYTASFLPMLTIGLIMVFIAQFFNNSTGALAFIILLYAAAKLIPFLVPQASIWSAFSYTDWYVLWVGNGASISKLLHSFVLLLAYCIMAYTAGLIMFDKKRL
jgi:ABC-2 type transport system permease protein